jgi:hypothetical protein
MNQAWHAGGDKGFQKISRTQDVDIVESTSISPRTNHCRRVKDNIDTPHSIAERIELQEVAVRKFDVTAFQRPWLVGRTNARTE